MGNKKVGISWLVDDVFDVKLNIKSFEISENLLPTVHIQILY